MSRFTYRLSKIVPGKRQRGYGDPPSIYGSLLGSTAEIKAARRLAPVRLYIYPHVWKRAKTPGQWRCDNCGKIINVLPGGAPRDCCFLPEPCPPQTPKSTVHPGPRGWWHATCDTYSEFFRTQKEAVDALHAALAFGICSQATLEPDVGHTCPVAPNIAPTAGVVVRGGGGGGGSSEVLVRKTLPLPGKYTPAEILAKFTRPDYSERAPDERST